jgi:2-phosphoglycerate kinase
MIGEKIEEIIKNIVHETLNENKNADKYVDLIQTDNIGEVIEKLSILHCRMWYLEDSISDAKTNDEVATLKKKIDICFKDKRPRLVQALNIMMDDAIKNGKSLVEDSVKLYKGFDENE